jgi:hypothetical protein
MHRSQWEMDHKNHRPYGLQFNDPQGLTTLPQQTMEGFVDDTDVAVNDATFEGPYTPGRLVQVLQADAQHWEILLFFSGGELELNKGFFYVLIWKFCADGLPSLTPKHQLPYTLMIKQGNDATPTAIKHKDCDKSHKTLGVMKAPNRSQAGEISRLTTKCNSHAQAILSNSVTASDSTILYRVYHLTSIGYSLGTTYITRKDFTKIQGHAVSIFLATSGYNRNTKQEIVFTPRAHGGIGMTELLLLQGRRGINLLRRRLLHHTEPGRGQIRIDIERIQQEAGTSQPILENTQNDLGYVKDGWVLGIRRFVTIVSAAITLLGISRPLTYRQGNSYIMDTFSQNGATTSELRKLN